MSGSRTDNVSKNAVFAVINYALKMILNFVSRKIFIIFLGVAYLGLNSLFSNIFSVLNLAELGIGSAIIFNMYKPVADNDEEKIKSLLNFYKKVYRVIGIVVIAAGLLIIPAIPFLISKEAQEGVPVDVNIYIVYLVLLLNTSISYFFAYKRCVLFCYQRNDIETKINSVSIVLLNVVQIFLICVTKNYYLYIIVTPICTMIECLLYYYVSNKKYGYLYENPGPLDSETKHEIKKNTIALMYHKIGSVLIYSTDGIIISAFLGLTILGCYSNYMLIISSITSLIAVVVNAGTSSIGNLIAECDSETVYKKFGLFQFIVNWVTGFCAICLLCLIQDFTSLFFGEEYMLSNWIVIALVVNFYLLNSRKMVLEFKAGAGIFVQDKYKGIIEAAINLTLDVVFIHFFGVIGVVLATTISTLLCSFWIEPHVTFKYLFKKSTKKYYLSVIVYFLATVLALFATYGVCSIIKLDNVYLNFLVKMVICCIIPNVVFIICSFKTNYFKQMMELINRILSRFKKRKNKTSLSEN